MQLTALAAASTGRCSWTDKAVPFMLRNIWTAGLLLFAAVMMSTFFIKTVWQVSYFPLSNYLKRGLRR